MSMHDPAEVKDFRLPDVGEGLQEAEIVSWLVTVGDEVEINQAVVEVETAKSIVELPSPFAGRVTALHVAAGETVPVGSVLFSIDDRSSTLMTDAATADDEPKLLVGYGAGPHGAGGPRRRRPAATRSSDVNVAPLPVSAPTVPGRPRTAPPLRKLAKDLGVELKTVRPSGPDGVIVRSDVLGAVGSPTAAGAATTDAQPRPEVLTRVPIKGVRKHTAAAMVRSAFTAPHVTEFVTVDVTRTLELRQRVLTMRDFRDVKVTPLAFVARAYLLALARTPMANASWDEAASEIVVPSATNLGIAAATPRGLLVPNIKGAERLGLRELAVAINDLAIAAREGRSAPEALTGGTSTITNLGVFGVDTGTPILNPGETAILAVGAIRRMPWVVEDEQGERLEARSVLQLALSVDHRVLDGAEGSRVLADTARVLEEPGLALL